MSGKRFECVIFDWDLTLVRVMGDISPEERLTALFQNAGLPYTLRQVQSAVRRYQSDLSSGRIQRPHYQQTEREINRYYQDILLRLGHQEVDWERIAHLYDAFAQLPYLPYDETQPVLEALQAKGMKFGLVTNHSRLIRPVLEETLGEFIEPGRMVISQEIGAYKPERRIYRHACALAQAKPSETIFVGDHLQVDAIGAVEAGGVGLGLWLDRNETLNGSETGNRSGGKTAVLPPNVARITSLWQILDYV